MSNYNKIITIEPGKRGGKPCIRGMRITVGDIWMLHYIPVFSHPDIQALTFIYEINLAIK